VPDCLGLRHGAIPRSDRLTERPSLSGREREIVSLVVCGFRNRDIAHQLCISEQTVKNHLRNIFAKVDIQDRLELALYAIYHRVCVSD
jgi:DNA-binding NarL/FixJ family response regulator